MLVYHLYFDVNFTLIWCPTAVVGTIRLMFIDLLQSTTVQRILFFNERRILTDIDRCFSPYFLQIELSLFAIRGAQILFGLILWQGIFL